MRRHAARCAFWHEMRRSQLMQMPLLTWGSTAVSPSLHHQFDKELTSGMIEICSKQSNGLNIAETICLRPCAAYVRFLLSFYNFSDADASDSFYRAILCRRKMSIRLFVRLSACLSVIRRYSVKTAKHIIKLFSPSSRHTILVFPYQTVWQYSDGDPLTWASNARGYEKDRDFR